VRGTITLSDGIYYACYKGGKQQCERVRVEMVGRGYRAKVRKTKSWYTVFVGEGRKVKARAKRRGR
jgi:hypothetical protein